MKAFEYVSPTSVEGAVDRLGEGGDALPLAGGMDLLGMMKDWVVQPDRLVNIKDVAGLDAIEETDGGGLRIGALVTVAEIADDERVRDGWPALAAAAADVGTPQIRNRGTLGGNLCQRPRCWYFRSELFECLRKGGSSCYAIDGDNRYHAILDNNTCPIVHPSNTAVPLLAYGARMGVAGPSDDGGASTREMEIAEFFVRPSQNVRQENVLSAQELVTWVDLAPSPGPSATYITKHKQSHDWPLGIATAVLEMDGGTVGQARIVMGSVAPVPWRSTDAEEVLAGRSVDAAAAREAAEAAVAGARPLDHNAYKVHIARTAVERAILEAAGIDWSNG